MQRRCKSCNREYRQQSADRIREQQREYRQQNADRMREYFREYYQQNADRKREYRQQSADRMREYNREYRQSNRGKFRSYGAARRALERSLPSETVLLRDVACRDGANCWMCGDELSEWNPAHLDHLIPIAADVDQLSTWGVENPGTVLANMALACPRCNIRKRDRIMLCAVARYLQNLDLESEIAA